MIMRTELFQTEHTLVKLFAFLLLFLVSSLSYAADPGKGSEIYARHCATCHGASGSGSESGDSGAPGSNVMPGAPNFAHGEGLMQPDALLLSSIKTGKNAMPAYRGVISDPDILDVIAYLRTLH